MKLMLENLQRIILSKRIDPINFHSLIKLEHGIEVIV